MSDQQNSEGEKCIWGSEKGGESSANRESIGNSRNQAKLYCDSLKTKSGISPQLRFSTAPDSTRKSKKKPRTEGIFLRKKYSSKD